MRKKITARPKTMDSVKRKERIENNLGLVHSCAHRFRAGIEYEDLYGAVVLG